MLSGWFLRSGNSCSEIFMNYRLLGRTGIRVSPLCLGTLNFGVPTPEAESIGMIHQALDAGINFIDTADMYNGGKSECIVGKALADGRRQQVILATKFHFPQSDDPNDRGNSRRHILNAVEASLRRLNTNWIDLYQVHRPVFDIPQDETLRALDDLVHQGKVRYIGSSTFPAWMIMEALAISERYNLARFVTEQPPYNLLDRRIENELLPLAQRYNISLLPWSPMAIGMLAGRYASESSLPSDSRGGRTGGKGSASIYADRITDAAIQRGNQIIPIAEHKGLTLAQLALLWVKDQPGVAAPIIGPRTQAQLVEALKVLDLSLDAETAAELDLIVPPGSAVANFHNNSGWMKARLSW